MTAISSLLHSPQKGKKGNMNNQEDELRRDNLCVSERDDIVEFVKIC